jgi:hypothetical protein
MKKQVVLVLFLALASNLYSQGYQGKWGIGVSLLSGSVNSFSHNADIVVPYWTSAKVCVQPRLGFIKKSGASQFRLGLDGYFHVNDGAKMSPYMTCGFRVDFDSKDLAGKSQSDISFNGGLGAEYFWHDKSSISGDAGILLFQDGASGAKALVQTYGQIMLRWYWK